MTRIYTCNTPIEADLVDAFCWLQKGFTDQFVYYDKERACRYMGLGRCIALARMRDVEYEYGTGAGSQLYFEAAKPNALDPAIRRMGVFLDEAF